MVVHRREIWIVYRKGCRKRFSSLPSVCGMPIALTTDLQRILQGLFEIEMHSVDCVSPFRCSPIRSRRSLIIIARPYTNRASAALAIRATAKSYWLNNIVGDRVYAFQLVDPVVVSYLKISINRNIIY